MTDLQALRALIEAVEAAGWGVTDWRNFQDIPVGNSGIPGPILAHRAYQGSLDAAKMLHGQLLPGWPKNLNFTEHASGYYCCIFGPLPDDAGKWDFAPKSEARAKTTARAWLIAILKAYEAQQ